MACDSEDTEVLLALLASLLNQPIHDQSVLLEALLECDGDAERAAQFLNTRHTNASSGRGARLSKVGKKRKSGGLDGWLEKPGPPTTSADTQSTKRSRPDQIKAPANVKPQALLPSSSFSLESPSRKQKHATHGEEILSSLQTGAVNYHAEPTSLSGQSSGCASPLKVKNVTNAEFMSILRPPNSSDSIIKPGPLKQTPLTLTTPEMIAKHVPCTMHTAVLPPELACRLFYTMLDLSRNWNRNKWWLFDRLVESPHKTSFFIRRYSSASNEESVEMDEAANFWYNGRQTGPSPPFPDAMEEACKYVEQVVNAEMHKRHRYPLEWGGDPPRTAVKPDGTGAGESIIWRANVAASNCYEGTREGVGFHSDALTYLGPYPTIASLSLGTNRIFRLREVVPTCEKDTRAARTYNIPLPHNSLTIMHASCQEMFKHAVPPQRTIDPFHPPYPPPYELQDRMPSESSNARINITFRFFRPDYKPSNTPKCKCGVPCILRPNMKDRHSLPVNFSDEQQVSSSSTHEGKDSHPRRDAVANYWWTCHAGAQNDGKGCGMWQVMDAKAEGRGPFAGEV